MAVYLQHLCSICSLVRNVVNQDMHANECTVRHSNVVETFIVNHMLHHSTLYHYKLYLARHLNFARCTIYICTCTCSYMPSCCLRWLDKPLVSLHMVQMHVCVQMETFITLYVSSVHVYVCVHIPRC